MNGAGARIAIILSETVEVGIRKGQDGRLAHSCGRANVNYVDCQWCPNHPGAPPSNGEF